MTRSHKDQLHEDESDMIVQDVVAHDHDTDDDETIGSTCHPDDVTEDHFHDDDDSSCREEVRVSDTEDGETRAPSTSHVTQGHLHEDESAMTEDHFHDDDGSSCQEEVRVSDTEVGAIADQGTHSSEEEFDFYGATMTHNAV